MEAQLHPDTEIGPVSIKITNMEQSLRFYSEVIGFRLLSRDEAAATAVLTADGKHPLLILEANPNFRRLPERSVSGLYHFAVLVPDRKSLGLVLRNLASHRIPIGQGDHLVSEALYLNDPDGNGIEIYADRPRETWQRNERGEYVMTTDPVDVDGLLSASEGADWNGLPDRTKIGHVHFHVGDLQLARRFYCETLGFEVTAHYGNSALFISAGGYHHHIGLNLWAGAGAPAAPEDAVGVRYFTVSVPNLDELNELEQRLIAGRIPFERHSGDIVLRDPFGIGIRIEISDREE
ncbi:VOC family protein [Paenibacillus sp. alder61]|uniref:VOC family protein n=1 Tax=Paenibacillus sp. alder61 TaxID=2862948 RepID=UPI001CD264CC|nr:VOC family protein [Paenibacillus sp. alder61]MCA1292101.1 VOC family protein [Paenibacillus sp. alder61]